MRRNSPFSGNVRQCALLPRARGIGRSACDFLAFVNQPLWPIKTVILAVFAIPAILLLLLGGWCRGVDKFRRDLGTVLLATAGYGAFTILSLFWMLRSPDVLKQMPPDFFRQFDDILSGVLCFILYLLLGVGLLFMPIKA